MSQKALDLLKEKFGDAVLETGSRLGDEWARITPESVEPVCRWFKHEPALDMKLLSDLTAVDYLHYDPQQPLALDDPQRFEVVYSLYSITTKQRVRLKVRCSAESILPSVTGVWRTADWWERTIFDLMGIRFAGHPNLRRILLYDEFKGHPLRKDYPVHLRQPLTTEVDVPDLVRGPGPGTSDKHSPFSQRGGARPNVMSDAYD